MVRPSRLNSSIEIPQLPAGLRVEAGCRLVQEQQIRRADKSARQREALLLPARQRRYARAVLLFELHQRHHIVGRGPLCKEAPEQPQCFADGQLVGQLCFLELDPQPLAQRRLIGAPAQAQHLHLARVGLGEALADLDGRGFPRAIRAQEAEAFARLHVEIDPVDGHHVLVGLAEGAYAQRSAGHFGAAAVPAFSIVRAPRRISSVALLPS